MYIECVQMKDSSVVIRTCAGPVTSPQAELVTQCLVDKLYQPCVCHQLAPAPMPTHGT